MRQLITAAIIQVVIAAVLLLLLCAIDIETSAYFPDLTPYLTIPGKQEILFQLFLVILILIKILLYPAFHEEKNG